MSQYRIDEHVRFRVMTPEGPLTGEGQIIKIFPAGQSYWLHVRLDDGSVRMLFESNAQVTRLDPVTA